MGIDLDKIVPEYNQMHVIWEGLLDAVKEQEIKIIQNNSFGRSEVMEIGLGNGALTKKLAKSFKKVWAVDASKSVIDYIKGLHINSNVNFIQNYIENLSLADNVDNLVLSHILEHLDDPVSSLRNIKKLMHADSIMYVNVPNAMSLHRQVGVKMGLLTAVKSLNEGDIKIGHKRVYVMDELIDHITKAGFHVVKAGGIMLKPISNYQIEKDWSKEMIEGFIKLGEDYPDLCGDIYVIAKRKI